ncbi:Hypothetical predicted protein [Mytilus galloprovincialis]|uniref:Retrotransposon gag domain-containing protein n=1 Tax=Mytilus galloprovincialis TaxID=29158 RepID=A0A8B6C9B0_MYTGA|nr:Hypothetical predicted protein [Mytilus galloprovincialis]
MVKTRSTRDHSGEDTYDIEINTEYSEDFESSDECTADTTVVQRPTTSQSASLLNLTKKNENSQKSEFAGSSKFPSKATDAEEPQRQVLFPISYKYPRRSNINRHISSSSSSSSDSDSESSGDEDRSPRVSKSKQQNSNRLPIFTGKEKWKVWFNRFEAVAHLFGWSKKEKLVELLPRLQGTAGDFVYDQLSSKVTQSYRRLVKELENRFGEIDTTKIYISRFNGRRQHTDESVQNFAAELKMLYDKGYPHRDTKDQTGRLTKDFPFRASR